MKNPPYMMKSSQDVALLIANAELLSDAIINISNMGTVTYMKMDITEENENGTSIEETISVREVLQSAGALIEELKKEVLITRRCAEARRKAIDVTFKRFVALRDKYEPEGSK